MRSEPRCMINHPNASGLRDHETPSFANPHLLDILLFIFQYPKTKAQESKPNYQRLKTKVQRPKSNSQIPQSPKINYHAFSLLTQFLLQPKKRVAKTGIKTKLMEELPSTHFLYNKLTSPPITAPKIAQLT